MNGFPAADFGLLDMERYFRFRGVRRLDYCSSQGCPFECAFCADPQVYKQRWSGLRADAGGLRDQGRTPAATGCSEVFFNDDNFFTDLRRTEAISRGLHRSGRARALVRHRPRRPPVPPDRRAAPPDPGQRLLQGERGRGEREPGRSCEADQEGHARRGGAGDRRRSSTGPGSGRASRSSPASRRSRRRAWRRRIARRRPCARSTASSRRPSTSTRPTPAPRWPRACRRSASRRPRTLEEWEKVDLDHSIGPWISEPVRRIGAALQLLPAARRTRSRAGGSASALLHCVARGRAKTDFYGFDFERRAVDLLEAAAHRPQPPAAADRGRLMIVLYNPQSCVEGRRRLPLPLLAIGSQLRDERLRDRGRQRAGRPGAGDARWSALRGGARAAGAGRDRHARQPAPPRGPAHALAARARAGPAGRLGRLLPEPAHGRGAALRHGGRGRARPGRADVRRVAATRWRAGATSTASPGSRGRTAARSATTPTVPSPRSTASRRSRTTSSPTWRSTSSGRISASARCATSRAAAARSRATSVRSPRSTSGAGWPRSPTALARWSSASCASTASTRWSSSTRNFMAGRGARAGHRRPPAPAGPALVVPGPHRHHELVLRRHVARAAARAACT